MMLAFAEIRRSRGRFLTIIGALGLITFLVLTLSALGDGLFYGSTGAYRASNADGYAFSSDAKGSLVRSRIPEKDIAEYQRLSGVTKASGVGLLLSSGTGPNGELDLAVFGINPTGAGAPTTLTAGRLPNAGENDAAAVDQSLASKGVFIGSTLKVGDQSVKVVGFTQDSRYQLQPTVWTTISTWRAMQYSVRPETRGLPPAVSAVAVVLADGTTTASLTPVGGTSVLATSDAALAIPGVKEQVSTLSAIIYATLLVAAVVVALFFALVVLEKRELFAALKALGTSTRSLGAGVIIQALVASIIGVLIGAIASRLFGLIVPEQIPIIFRSATLVQVCIFTVLASIIGALFSLRRIARIDPATALGGALL